MHKHTLYIDTKINFPPYILQFPFDNLYGSDNFEAILKAKNIFTPGGFPTPTIQTAEQENERNLQTPSDNEEIRINLCSDRQKQFRRIN